MKQLIALLIAIVVSGCASNLIISGEKNSGVPFNTPVLVIVQTTTTYEAIPGKDGNTYEKYCTPDIEVDIESLPLGDRYYANIKPSLFADGEFSIEFNDKGGLSKISMNSKASSGVDKMSGLLSTVLPFVRAPKTAADGSSTEKVVATSKAKAAADIKAENCLKKKVEKVITGRQQAIP